MPRAFGFDGDSAYYESLEAKIRSDEAARKASESAAALERRRSLGLPDNEPKSRRDRKVEKQLADPEGKRKKSVGEKVMNFVFNGGRSDKMEMRQVDRIGLPDGKVVKRGVWRVGSSKVWNRRKLEKVKKEVMNL